ncbi:phospholipase D-like domain-containing protein [Fodinicola acaciae]|uniref:phospholipase D-like domain-containing protein n=1 Tax=Fodinicola acaciae TaxID=2681555 RepID=UPI0013D18264|nr:phospholipase D-like domain-containing protein [Fodinicola acaciae]
MPEVIDLGDVTVPGDFFVERASPSRTEFVPSTPDDAGIRHTFTYLGGGSRIRDDLIELIDGASRKVFVASFFIGDDALREALYRAAERLTGGVYVISAMTDRDLDKAINEVDEDAQVDKQLERKRFEDLTRHGIAVRAYEGCHAKFAVIDDRVALVSSANLMTRAFEQTGENGVVVDVPAHVDRLARFFAVLWQEAQWEMPLTESPVVTRIARTHRSKVALPAADPDAVGPIWTFDDQHLIKDAIASVIASARTELLLATYSLVGIARRPDLLLDHVRAAVERGVRVRMLLRGSSRFLADAGVLADVGVDIYPCLLNHAKGLIADRRRGALFSANYDAVHGIEEGVEAGFRLDGTSALAEALRYFEQAMAERDLDFLRNPHAAALAGRTFASTVSKWPLPATLEVMAEDAAWDALKGVSGPTIFHAAEGVVLLSRGRRTWRLDVSRDPATPAKLVVESQRERTAAGDRLRSWLTERRTDGSGGRGICAAVFRRAGN